MEKISTNSITNNFFNIINSIFNLKQENLDYKNKLYNYSENLKDVKNKLSDEIKDVMVKNKREIKKNIKLLQEYIPFFETDFDTLLNFVETYFKNVGEKVEFAYEKTSTDKSPIHKYKIYLKSNNVNAFLGEYKGEDLVDPMSVLFHGKDYKINLLKDVLLEDLLNSKINSVNSCEKQAFVFATKNILENNIQKMNRQFEKQYEVYKNQLLNFEKEYNKFLKLCDDKNIANNIKNM